LTLAAIACHTRPRFMAFSSIGNARVTCIFVVVLAFGVWSFAASAQQQGKALGSFDGWHAVEFAESGGKACIATAVPAKSESNPAGARRGDIAFTITHRTTAKTRDEISFNAGYPLRDENSLTVIVDKTKRFEFPRRLKGYDEIGWTRDTEMDKQLIAALRAGKELVVTGVSRRGTTTTDNFNLGGFAKALDAANKACGLR
jgi:hypothetical protein